MKLHMLLWGVVACVANTSPIYAQQTAPEESPDEEGGSPTGEMVESSTSRSAEDKKRANARALATDASSDYRMGRFQDAYDNFDRAFRLVEVPALGVWSARSLRQLDRLVEASERYREVIRTGAAADAPASHHQSIKDARAELDELLPRIPSLLIRLQNANAEDVEIKMDGEVVEPALVGVKQRVNPGQKAIVATRGNEVVETSISLRERTSEEVVLTFKPGYQVPTEEAEPGGTSINVQQGFTPLETVGIVIMSGGGALLVAGGVTTVIALGQQADLRTNCPSRKCTDDFHKDVDNFNTMKLLSTGALIGGAVLGGVGAIIYVTGGQPKQEADPSVALYVQGTSLGLKGAF